MVEASTRVKPRPPVSDDIPAAEVFPIGLLSRAAGVLAHTLGVVLGLRVSTPFAAHGDGRAPLSACCCPAP
jgi:hypothetical protein